MKKNVALCILALTTFSVVWAETCEPTGLSGYQKAMEILQNINLVPKLKAYLEQCYFGKMNYVANAKLCFGHCSMRNNCLSVAIPYGDYTGCQMCTTKGMQTMDSILLDFDTVYVRRSHVQGISLLIRFKF